MAKSVPDRNKNRSIKNPNICDECGSIHLDDKDMTLVTEGKPFKLKSSKY